MTQYQQRWLGAAFWLCLLVGVSAWMRHAGRLSEPTQAATAVHASPAALMLDSLWTSSEVFVVDDPTGVVRMGDAVFAPQSDELSNWHEVGYVTGVRSIENAANRITVTMFDPQVWSPTSTFTIHRNSGRIEDVLQMLMPEPKREQLQQKLAAAFESHADAVAQEMLPLVMESLQATVPVIEKSLVEAIERHEDEMNALVSRYRDELLRKRLVPLVRQEVIPIVRRHGQEPAEAIGREVWHQASLWRFGWRAIYDKSPLPERELVAEEWRRFVDQEVVPIVEDHLDEIALAVENMLRDLAGNERLRDELSQVVSTVATDPQARDLFRMILRETIVDNQGLRQTWVDIWSSPAAKARLQRVGQRLEPILRELGDELMGTREGGIEPGFARVLRNQILNKDKSWITIVPADNEQINPKEQSSPIRLTPAKEFAPYPVVYLAK
jgi:hypothetical protein